MTRVQGRYSEALPLLERVLAIRRSELGENHRDTLLSESLLQEARQEHVSGIGMLRMGIMVELSP